MIDPGLADALAASQHDIAAWMRQHEANESARTGSWSVRDVAAHLATTEVECYEPRLQAIASGSRPRFTFYSNDNRDFSGVTLEAALAQWAVTRSRVLDFVRLLSQDELLRVGVHSRFGEITVARYLGIVLDHDAGHLRDLEREASGPAR